MKSETKNTLFVCAAFIAAVNFALPALNFVRATFARPVGPEHQIAVGMSPAIRCLEFGERPWRATLSVFLSQYQISQGPPPRAAMLHPFSNWIAQGNGLSQEAFRKCSTTLGDTIRAYGAYPDMAELASQYTSSVTVLKDINQALDRVYRYPSGELPSTEQRDLHDQLLPAVQDFFKASQALRENLEYHDIRLRPLQLNRLVAGHDPDQHWYILNFMLHARQAIDDLDSSTRLRTLDPEQLQRIEDPLYAAWKDADNYMARHQRLEGAQGGSDRMTLWARINEHAEAASFLNATDHLLTDWRAHGAPQQLSDDYLKIGEAYDRLLDRYNYGATVY